MANLVVSGGKLKIEGGKTIGKIEEIKVPKRSRMVRLDETAGEDEVLERDYFQQDKDAIDEVIGVRRRGKPKRDNTVLSRGS